MIIWDHAPEGYLECVVNDWYGVVGLAHPAKGWMARVDSPSGERTAPDLYHTAREAKLWVEQQIAHQLQDVGAEAAAPYSASVRRSMSPRTPNSSWWQVVAHAVHRAVATYYIWNTAYLDPRCYGQTPLCYATAHVGSNA